jgi:phosphoenolpyruvate carboxylase
MITTFLFIRIRIKFVFSYSYKNSLLNYTVMKTRLFSFINIIINFHSTIIFTLNIILQSVPRRRERRRHRSERGARGAEHVLAPRVLHVLRVPRAARRSHLLLEGRGALLR